MQSVSSRIWTRITVSIAYDDNHYTTGTSFELSEMVDFRLKDMRIFGYEQIERDE